jgi:hypothetical protein
MAAREESERFNPAISCIPTSGSMFALGTHTIKCEATDMWGNIGSSTAEVIVQDTIAPEIVAPADQTFEATGATTTPSLVMATSTDPVDTNPVITYDIHDFKVGTTTVTWTATDFSLNASTVTSLVTITDTTLPVITLSGDASVSLTVGSSYADAGATATDLVDGNMTVIVGGSVDTLTAGTYTLTYDASDVAGNKATQVTRTVIVNAQVVVNVGGGGSGWIRYFPTPDIGGGSNGGSTGGSQGNGGSDNEQGEQTPDGDNGSDNGLAGDQGQGDGAGQLAALGTPLNRLNGANDNQGAGNDGDAENQGTPESQLAGASTPDNGQAAAVALAGSGWHFPGWAQLLALLAVLAGFGSWFFLYRRKNA